MEARHYTQTPTRAQCKSLSIINGVMDGKFAGTQRLFRGASIAPAGDDPPWTRLPKYPYNSTFTQLTG